MQFTKKKKKSKWVSNKSLVPNPFSEELYMYTKYVLSHFCQLEVHFLDLLNRFLKKLRVKAII